MQKRSLNLMKFLNATCLTNTVTTKKLIDDLLLVKLSKAQFLNKLRLTESKVKLGMQVH